MPTVHDIQAHTFRGALNRHPGAAQVKWPRLTAGDLTSAKTERALARIVRERYSLTPGEAASDVHIWIGLQR
jgi:hypothetical protein